MPNFDNGQSSRGSIALALPDSALLQEPNGHTSTRPVASSSVELITSTGTSPVFVHATSISQNLAPVTLSQTGSNPNSGLGSPNPIDTSSAALFSSAKSRLPLHIQPTQITSGNLPPTVDSSASIPATASLPFPSSSPSLNISTNGSLQNGPHPTTSLEGISTTPFTSQGVGQSFTVTSLSRGSETPFSTDASARPASAMTTPFLVTSFSFQTSIVATPSLGGSVPATDAFPSDWKVLAASSLTDSLPHPTTLSSSSSINSGPSPELSNTLSGNRTVPDGEMSTSLPSKTITIWAPTSTVTTPPTKSLNAIVGGSIAAGVATLLLFFLFLGLYLRRKYKKPTYHHNLAHDRAPSSYTFPSASLNVYEPIDTLERQGRNMTSSATIFNKRRRSITPNPYPVSHASQAQISTSTYDTTLLQQEGDNSVTNVHSRGLSFGGENYYNSVLEDFSPLSSEYAWSDDPGHNVHNSKVGSLEAPGTRPLSRMEPDPSVQIGIAI